jgi:DNA-binding SARP family transcriptional activator
MATPQTGARPAVASDELEIRLLGDFAIIQSETPLPDLDSPRLQAFLAYLILRRDAPQLRHHLAFQLWPDSSESQARTNLRNLLHRLRRSWPQWQSLVDVRVDVAEFEHALARSIAAGSREEEIAGLRAAIEAYSGDLLPSCYDDWILPERSRLRRDYLAGLERLSGCLAETMQWPEAIRHAQRLAREEPLREASHRRLMHYYLAAGDRAGALRVYYQCADMLEQELGIGPGAETQAIYHHLLNAPESSAPVVENLQLPPAHQVVQLVGR